jgi:hypothetical protein
MRTHLLIREVVRLEDELRLICQIVGQMSPEGHIAISGQLVIRNPGLVGRPAKISTGSQTAGFRFETQCRGGRRDTRKIAAG